MSETKIEWTDRSWNPVTGCLGPRGDGLRCSYCYARRLAMGRLKPRYLANRHVLDGLDVDPFAPRYWPARMDEPRSLRKPSRIFVVDMGDLFGPWVPDRIIEEILAVVRSCDRHTFQFLTKWPDRLARWNPWPENCWVGATVTNDEEACKTIRHLCWVDAPVRYWSAEPLLAPIRHLPPWIRWLIVGAQTGPGAKPVDREAVQLLIDMADARAIPVFLKDNLHWPEKRQEWPVSRSGERMT
jgi:protein gp37